MKRFIFTLFVVLFLMTGAAYAVGTCVESARIIDSVNHLVQIPILCTADAADATFPSTTVNVLSSFTGISKSYVMYVETNPGSTAPTASYDIVLNNAGGRDIMAGGLANRSATATEISTWDPRYANSDLTLAITNNSVNSATIQIDIYYYYDQF